MTALRSEVQSLQQTLQGKDTELAQAQQQDSAQVSQLEAARQDLANKLTLAQSALKVCNLLVASMLTHCFMVGWSCTTVLHLLP